jgi:hypothetical protein
VAQVNAIYRPFRMQECGRCGDVVLTGTAAGVVFTVDPVTVPRAHALVLYEYAIPVLVLDEGETAVTGDFWDPHSHDLARPGRHLVIPPVWSRLRRHRAALAEDGQRLSEPAQRVRAAARNR